MNGLVVTAAADLSRGVTRSAGVQFTPIATTDGA